jgi:TfoX/Sxy family transcriptional regulator of competence genes
VQPTLDDLRVLLEDATAELPDVTVRKAFGSFGFYARGSIFALAWRGSLRIGVKLPDDAARATLLAERDTSPWAPRGKALAGWVLGPARWHDDPDALRAWVRRAWDQATNAAVEDALPSMRERLREVASPRSTPARSAKRAASAKPPTPPQRRPRG